MSAINAILGYPLGWIMYAIYYIVHNYGVALVVFTIITKLIMVPMSVKQQKGMAKMASVQPQMQEIQAKYKNNPQKLQEEMQLLYQRENYNPMSGCMPLLIQFPILFGLIDVIYHPLKHILRMSKDLIAQAIEISNTISTAAGAKVTAYTAEMNIIPNVKANPDAFSALGEDFITKVQEIDFTFLGMDLGEIPTFAFNIFIIIPILSLLTSVLLSWVSMKTSSAAAGDNAQSKAMSLPMMIMMPLMSAWITFTVPVGVGLYWIFSNIFAVCQSLILFKLYNPKEMAEKAKAEAEARREQLRQEKIEAKKLAKEGDKEAAEKALSQKEINSMKLAAARKKMAEKYGEDYKDENN